MTRVLLIDDHAIVRRGLREIVESEFSDLTVGEAENRIQALQNVRNHNWDIITLDIAMPDISGSDLLKVIKKEAPHTPVLVFSMYPPEQYAVRMIKGGVSAYLSKDSNSDEIIIAMRKLLNGERYITPVVADLLAASFTSGFEPEVDQPHELLSDREYEVFLQLASGHSLTEISKAMSLSVKTISTYRSRINKKMGTKSNADLTLYAARHELLT